MPNLSEEQIKQLYETGSYDSKKNNDRNKIRGEKTFYKKWWFWAIVGLSVIIIGVSSQESSEPIKEIKQDINQNGIVINQEVDQVSNGNEAFLETETLDNTGIAVNSSVDNIANTNSGDYYIVKRVIDGDTIEISTGDRVRYIGIDTPETSHPSKPIECFGKEASDKNKQLVEGKKVRLEKDVSETDKYGRLLRYVYVDNIFVNLELVKLGYAYSSTYPPDVKYQSQFLAAQNEARENGRGLWSACQENTTNTDTNINSNINTNTAVPFVPPSSDTNVNTNTNTTPTINCTIKGNINSKGEKIYHIIGCPDYSRTIIDESKGERWFCTEAEALAAGWRKALNCP